MAPKDTRWEANFKLDIPEFPGGIRGDLLLDWLVEVEEILELQRIPDDRLVSLVAKKFRGQAASWWQQVKTTRKQAGKTPVKSWDKLKQKLCATFLPRNYDRTMYSINHLQNWKRRVQFVDDYPEDCHVQEKDLSTVHGIDDAELCTMEPCVYGGPIFAVKDDADRVAYEDQIQDENTNFVVSKFDNSVEDVKTKSCAFDIYDPVYDVCDKNYVDSNMKNCAREDFIGNEGVEYTTLSLINNLDEKDEVSYMDKENHNSSISLANRHRKINSEPPDPGRSEVLFFRDGEIIEVEVLEKTKLLVPLRHWGLITEDLRVSYEIVQKEDGIHMSRSTIEFLNWVFDEEDLMQILSCPQLLISVGGANIINHLNFFLTMGATITKKRRVMDMYVHNKIIMVLLSREIKRVRYVATNSMSLLLETDEALSIKTSERRKIFQMLFEVRERAQSWRSNICNFVFDHLQLELVLGLELLPLPLTLCDVPLKSQVVLTYWNKYTHHHPLPSCIRISLLARIKAKEAFVYQFTLHEQFTVRTTTNQLHEHLRSQMKLVLLYPRFFWEANNKSKDVVLIYGAMADVSTLPHHQLFDLSIREICFFVDRRNHKIKVKWIFLIHVLISYMGVSMDLDEVKIVKVSNATCFVSFAQRLVLPYNSSLACVFVGWETFTFFWPLRVHNIVVSLAQVFTMAQWVSHPFILLQDSLSFVTSTQRMEAVSINHLGFSIEVTTCLRWMENVLNYNENVDSGELFKTHTSSEKSHPLVIVSSFVIVLVVGGMSKVHLLLHHHDLVNVESTSCGVLTWVNRTGCNSLLDSCYISTTFICWSDVACDSRKLLTCGKSRFSLVPFSTVDYFRPCKELPIKLLNMILEIQSSSHIQTTTLITNIEFMMKLLFWLLEDYTRRGGANLCRLAECALTHVSNQFFCFSPCCVVYGIFSRYPLALTSLSTRSCFHRHVVDFVDALQLDPTQATENLEFPSSNDKANLSVIRQRIVFVSGDSGGDLDVDLHAKFKSLCARCLTSVSHENIVLRKEMILLKSKMQRIEEMLVCAKEDSKKLKIKFAATHKCFCALKNEIHDVMQLKAELVAEKETSARLEKELMAYKKNLRMLNSGTKKLDHILSMGRTGKTRFGLGYRGGTYNSKTIFVPENLSKSSRSWEKPDSRPNPFPPGET